MEAAIASLDRGVRALFQVLPPTPTHVSHPLCECKVAQAPGPDWRALRHFPVLKRHVVRQYAAVTREVTVVPPTTSTRKPRSSRDALLAYKGACLAALCLKLVQCHVLRPCEHDVGASVGTLESLDVLARVVCGAALPLSVRLLVLSFAVRAASSRTDVHWIDAVCTTLRAELVDVVATGRGKTKGTCRFCRQGTTPALKQVTPVVLEAMHAVAGRTPVAALREALGASSVQDVDSMEKVWGGTKRKRSGHVDDTIPLPWLGLAQYQAIITTVSSARRVHHALCQHLWDRQLARHVVAHRDDHISLDHILRDCVVVDTFATRLRPAQTSVTHLPGFQVWTHVIQTVGLSLPGLVNTAVRLVPRTPHVRRPWTTKRMVQAYVHTLVTEEPHVLSPTSTSSMDEYTLLALLFDLVVHPQAEARQCFDLWDATILASRGAFPSTATTSSVGLAWCLYLEHAVETRSPAAPCAHTFASYCHVVVDMLIRTGGAVVSSGGTRQCNVPCRETERALVSHVVATLMKTLGHEWIKHLVAQVLATPSRQERHPPRGVRTLLFPALTLCLTQPHDFATLVTDVYHVLTERDRSGHHALAAVLHFCHAWDTVHAPRTHAWGRQAMTTPELVPHVLEYATQTSWLQQETHEVVQYLATVLQSVTQCPATLEPTLWTVLATIPTIRTQESPSSSSSLVSHSSALLERLVRAVQRAEPRQTQALVTQVKAHVGTLDELRQHVTRWWACLETHGAAFAGKETRLELVKLCTRLARWFPRDFEPLQGHWMTRLEAPVLSALKAFVKQANRAVPTAPLPSVLHAPAHASAVRVDMALHAYLARATWPDLETLTHLLLKATIKCRSHDAFDQLARLVHKHERLLVVESIPTTLQAPLRGVDFVSTASRQDAHGGGATHERTKRAKASIYLDNTLKLVPALCKGKLAWSSALFSARSAIVWLPYLFQYVLEPAAEDDECSRATMLFTCLDMLHDRQAALEQASWLAAMLSTAVMACARRRRQVKDDVRWDRLRHVTRDVLETVGVGRGDEMKEREGGPSEADSVRGLVTLSRSTMLRITLDETSVYCSEQGMSDHGRERVRWILARAWERDDDAASCPPRLALFLPFSHWLSSALVYSQSLLDDTSLVPRQWDATFTSYVTDVYLHVEFHGDTAALLTTWLTTWMTLNLARTHEHAPLLALLPSQVALFHRLALTPEQEAPAARRPSWQLVFAALDLVVETTNSFDTAVAAIELVASTLTTLEVVDVAASLAFPQLAHVDELEGFFQALERLVAHPAFEAWSALQVYYLLQYPLELVVCVYACKIPRAAHVLSDQVVTRVKKVLFRKGDARASRQDEQEDKGAAGVSGSSSRAEVDATEMEAFCQDWTDEMLLKYDKVDPQRCAEILEIIQAAFMPTIQETT